MSFPRPERALPLTLRTVTDLVGAGARLTHGDPETVVTGVSLDTATLRPGDLWAALPGARAHGADFADPALEAGAVAVLTDADGVSRLTAKGVELPVVECETPREVLGRVAAALYDSGDQRPTMFGITGTNGKTTTAYLMVSALEALGHTTGLIGTIETRIGDERIRSVRTTPETTDLHALLATMGERGIDDCVMEVSSHALSLHRVDEVVYDVALFANLSRDHLDFHGTMEDYFLAKASLFTPERSRRAVVCVDDEWGQRLAQEATVPVTTVTSRLDVEADWIIGGDPREAQLSLTGADHVLHLESALPGDFNRVNTAMAAVALVEAGISPEQVAEAVLARPRVPGRMEVVLPSDPDREDLPRAIVDFAHTPDAVGAALAALRPQTNGVLVVVLGAGGSRDPGKRPGMGASAAAHADVVIVTDDNPREEDPAAIRDAVAEGVWPRSRARLEVIEGRVSAIERAVEIAHESGPGATVAVPGKGHEQGQEVRGQIRDHDDRAVLRAALDRRSISG
ncbi:UDP-N-acetylmuramoyl-L-alanyl-D-glutamate--2,6-diaminopimelate ligase [Janibacter limosus]|uniref:UDP-N-acetylmuramoyl-L-alanyl-D-glutamate--2, 6-diaminopimelate ligase n=1 Tax=Janibacter limosus TaxID=53458 RepID=A0AC61U730_9MICO|nr:UDP-N-acetylmuramoyl-L-alanyl-D-glutamate--2,6-diaminopimelate ligase [Janibacter limosus]UUZ45840.1 UDP-N-acetylmuramoyl-L-alanyl-D-glutamate--2,6-diaminopimelate ligase [Janibacter limosus]